MSKEDKDFEREHRKDLFKKIIECILIGLFLALTCYMIY
jgi:hypothetical protein